MEMKHEKPAEMQGKRLCFLTLWAVNGPLDVHRLKNQLNAMKKCGFDGTIFHPRYYPDQPPYMSKEYLEIMSELILYAKELEMEFWIYDENGWPSGSGNGKVLERFPESVCEWLEYRNGQVVKKQRGNFNTFIKEEVDFFIEEIYEGYRKGLAPEAFAWVTGFFSDEVGFLDGHGASIQHGGIPWCEEAEERYRRQYGKELCEKWERLFTDGEGCGQVRYRYWQILSDILADHFYHAINQWCERYGKRYTAHLKGEETLFFQIPCSGSLYRNLREVNLPAVDALERYPGNHYYPRVASSLSRQFSDGECMAEAFGGSGWGLSPENVVDYVDWLAESGITRFALHLWQYEKNSNSIRDWPPDIPMGLTWRETWTSLLRSLHRKWDGRVGKKNTVLLVAPERGVMAGFRPSDSMCLNEHDGDGTPDTDGGRISAHFGRLAERLYEEGISFDVTNERLLEEQGRVKDGKLYLGHMVYSTVIFGEGVLFEDREVPENCRACGITMDASQLEWEYVGCPVNQVLLLLERQEAGGSGWYGEIAAEPAMDMQSLQVRTQEPAAVLSVCKIALDIQKVMEREGAYYYAVPDDAKERIRNEHFLRIDFTPENPKTESPFVFIEGRFLVKNRSGYVRKDERQYISEDCFYLTGSVRKLASVSEEEAGRTELDLIGAGLPFCGSYVTVRMRAVAGEKGLILGNGNYSVIYADAARVRVDGTEAGYIWGPDWHLTDVAQGMHTIELDLFPSTFNTYGPHHHYQGDRALTSPLQYSGEKAFADDDDAPEYTLIPQWHFVKFGIS
ncbi:MAG: hypothetical protein LIP12_13680 [Clostridiales bacterium]|nr:hypothetical protein [Clostridiales bacterium]